MAKTSSYKTRVQGIIESFDEVTTLQRFVDAGFPIGKKLMGILNGKYGYKFEPAPLSDNSDDDLANGRYVLRIVGLSKKVYFIVGKREKLITLKNYLYPYPTRIDLRG